MREREKERGRERKKERDRRRVLCERGRVECIERVSEFVG